MPHFSRNCSIDQGFNFRKDRTTPVGFITEMKIGTKALATDINVFDPMNPTTALKVVSVLSLITWGIGVTDPLEFAGQISVDNRQDITQLAYLDLSNVESLFKFQIYDYDPKEKKYYQCFTCKGTEMKGIIQKDDADLHIGCSDDAGTEVKSPLNFGFYIGIVPQPIAQSLTLATADQKNVVKNWGVKVG